MPCKLTGNKIVNAIFECYSLCLENILSRFFIDSFIRMLQSLYEPLSHSGSLLFSSGSILCSLPCHQVEVTFILITSVPLHPLPAAPCRSSSFFFLFFFGLAAFCSSFDSSSPTCSSISSLA